MIDKNQKVAFLTFLNAKIEPLSYSYSAEEKSIIRRILNEEQWHLLTDDEKQSRRKASISLGKKWSTDYFLGTREDADYNYDEGVVVVYDAIRYILNKIDIELTNLSTDLLRIKAFMVIEKDFIDESPRANKHLPIDIFKNFAGTLAKDHPDLRLDDFYFYYSGMYEKWPNKPKQPI